MGRRPNREHVEQHQFRVMVPARLQEPAFRFPAMREDQRIAREHPGKIHPLVDRRRRPHDLRVGAEALAHREDAGQEQGTIDRRQLARPLARARAEVDEVIEPAALVNAPPGKEPQRRRARPTASARGIQPRSAAMHNPVRPNPVDAMLPTSRAFVSTGDPFVRARSRTIPVAGSACSQKNMNDRFDRSSSSASSAAESVRAPCADCAPAGWSGSASQAIATTSVAMTAVRPPGLMLTCASRAPRAARPGASTTRSASAIRAPAPDRASDGARRSAVRRED